ncbi:MAG TPA: MFS transporter [Acidothermaceae bacterium]
MTAVGGSLFRLAIGAVPFLLPLMFQDAFGWSPLKSGVLVVAVFLGNIAIKPFTGPLLRRFGFRNVLVHSALWSAVTIALCGLVTAHTPLVLTALILFASGVFRSIGFTAYNTISFVDVPPGLIGDANTLTTTIQQLTMGLGVVAGALALRAGPDCQILRCDGRRAHCLRRGVLPRRGGRAVCSDRVGAAGT